MFSCKILPVLPQLAILSILFRHCFKTAKWTNTDIASTTASQKHRVQFHPLDVQKLRCCLHTNPLGVSSGHLFTKCPILPHRRHPRSFGWQRPSVSTSYEK